MTIHNPTTQTAPRHQVASRRLPAISIIAVAALTLASCGGDDDAQPSPQVGVANDATSADTTGNDTTSDDATGQLVEGGVVDVLADAMGEDGEAVRDALAAVPSETMFAIVADQLDPRPTVEIAGNDIRLVFDGGTVDNATFDCIVAGSFLEQGQTLTVIYPDGRQVC